MQTKDKVYERDIALLVPAARTATHDSAAQDIRQFQSPVRITLNTAKASAGINPTLTPTITHADAEDGDFVAMDPQPVWHDEDGNVVTAVTAAADQCISCLVDPRDTDGFIKLHGAVAGANASYVDSATMAVTDLYPVES